MYCSIACSLLISRAICSWPAASWSTCRGRRNRVGSALFNRGGLRRQPAKLRGRVRDHLSRRIAIGLPRQGGSYPDAKRDEEAGDRERDSHPERLPPLRGSVILQVGRADNRRLDRWLDG